MDACKRQPPKLIDLAGFIVNIEKNRRFKTASANCGETIVVIIILSSSSVPTFNGGFIIKRGKRLARALGHALNMNGSVHPGEFFR